MSELSLLTYLLASSCFLACSPLLTIYIHLTLEALIKYAIYLGGTMDFGVENFHMKSMEQWPTDNRQRERESRRSGGGGWYLLYIRVLSCARGELVSFTLLTSFDAHLSIVSWNSCCAKCSTSFISNSNSNLTFSQTFSL